ncbi:MAG: MIP family channel protein [Oscillospiraceae bacterium]|nr:MIP family channel protein [Oscillospiraceae bacterium]
MKKYIAEFLGTMTLVLFGCGTAVVCGGFTGGTGVGYLGVAAIALAFGLAIVAAAYAIGDISGCHVNPAVSLAVLINGKMSVTDFVGYVIAQIAGAFAGSGILYAITKSSDMPMGYGSNGFDELSGVGLDMVGAFVVEVVLTFVFIMTILGVTRTEKTSSLAGIVIGLTLTFVHLIGIPLTGTSVNPARSLSPAVLEGGDALSQVWLFIVAPFVGAIIAGLAHKFLFAEGKKADK